MPFLDALSDRQLDALKEVGNVGAGHAATALSQLTGRTVYITVPRAHILTLDEIPGLVGDAKTLVAGILMNILGDSTGKILLLFPRDSALRLAEILLKKPTGSIQILNEMGHSAIKEAGNILVGAYLSALNEFLGLLLLISVPMLVFDIAEAVLKTLTVDHEPHAKAFCIETQFSDDEQVLNGYFLLIPDEISLKTLVQALKVS